MCLREAACHCRAACVSEQLHDSCLSVVLHVNPLVLGHAGVTEDLYEDNAALRNLAFNYRNRPDAFSYTSSIAHSMHSYPVEHVLQVWAIQHWHCRIVRVAFVAHLLKRQYGQRR